MSTTRGSRVTTQLAYRFKDGSIDDEVAVFSQRGHFQLISDHHVQQGPAFDQAIETTIVVASGHVTVRYKDEHGVEKTEDERMELPSDLANGMLIAPLVGKPADDAPPTERQRTFFSKAVPSAHTSRAAQFNININKAIT